MKINQTFEVSRAIEEDGLVSGLSPNPEDSFPPFFVTLSITGW